MDIQAQIRRFEEETGRLLSIKDGCPFYYCRHFWDQPWPLDLCHENFTALPDNLIVVGDLLLCHTKITALPNNLIVGGNLNLCYTNITALPDNLVVGGDLLLCDSKISALPDNLVVGGNLLLYDTKITALPDNLIVGGDLNLCYENFTALPDNLVVCGDLLLCDSKISALPNNLVVGGDLYISDMTNHLHTITIGKDIIIKNFKQTDLASKIVSLFSNIKIKKLEDPLVKWENNGRQFIKVNDTFSELICQRGHVMHIRLIGSNDIYYLVTDGNGHYAYGETFEEAKISLYCQLNERDESAYEGLTMDDSLAFEEAVVCYRTITEACEEGVASFIKKQLPKPHKDFYTIREIVQYTEDQYGHDDFKSFFEHQTKSDEHSYY